VLWEEKDRIAATINLPWIIQKPEGRPISKDSERTGQIKRKYRKKLTNGLCHNRPWRCRVGRFRLEVAVEVADSEKNGQRGLLLLVLKRREALDTNSDYRVTFVTIHSSGPYFPTLMFSHPSFVFPSQVPGSPRRHSIFPSDLSDNRWGLAGIPRHINYALLLQRQSFPSVSITPLATFSD